MNKRIIIVLMLVFFSFILACPARAASGLFKGSGPEVFLIKSEERHWIKSPQVFSELGYKWQDIIEIEDKELNQYALGFVIASSNDLNKLNEGMGGEVEKIIKSEEPVIKIGIYGTQNGEIFQITANGPYEIYKDEEFLTIKNKGEIFETTINHRFVFKFIPKTKDTVFKIKEHRLKGLVELKHSPESRLVWVINELGLEDYLRGVAEVIDLYPTECLKSLAVAARSYALFHIENGGKYPGEPFHLRDWTYDQLYKGYEFESQSPNFSKAIEETKGMIAVFSDKPILGVFSYDSGGTTQSACGVWKGIFCNEEYKYLWGGIKDLAGTEHNYSNIKISHGVGLSAVGAERLAQTGKIYQEILKYYYPGSEIKKLY